MRNLSLIAASFVGLLAASQVNAGCGDSEEGAGGSKTSDGGGGSNGSGDGGGGASTSSNNGGGGSDVGPGGGGSGAGGGNEGCGAAKPITLTVKNVKFWCDISVDGGAGSTADEISVCVAEGEVDLVAKRASSVFTVDGTEWHHADDEGEITGEEGDDRQNATTVTVSEDTCVWICCPFSDGSGCSPEAPDNIGEQCP